jgi:cytochrome b561
MWCSRGETGTGARSAPWLQTRMTPYFHWTSASRRTRRDFALYCGVLVVLIGTLALVPDSWIVGAVKSKAAIQAVFGVLLSGLVIVRYAWWLKYCPPVSAADIRLFSRRLSRMVYLVLYLIIGAQLIVNIIGGLEGEAAGPAQDLTMLKPANQAFVAYGLIALVLIRVLAYLTWRRYRSSLEPRGPLPSAQQSSNPAGIPAMRRVLKFLNNPR